MKLSEFKNRIEWRNFFKIIGVITFLLLFTKLTDKRIPPPDDVYFNDGPLTWFEIIFYILLLSILLLSKAYIELKMKELMFQMIGKNSG